MLLVGPETCAMKTPFVSEPVPTNEIPDGVPDAIANTALVAILLLNPALKALALTVAELVSRNGAI